MKAEKSLRVCVKGHKFYKSSECQSCPKCNDENRPEFGFLSKLSSPARNALLHDGIETLQELSKYSEKEILKIHGIGPASLPILRSSLKELGLSFKENTL
ncbi:RNA polymerase alpha subunit C-terminal domain-containing protein [Ureibacillus chungkukjangi]|uniref:RNA polymerase alpha subunit n=1 Tax=Ureibacillus chungkukjangi TaxID=1202712 RepID=A0A318TXQ5_9BACL|nr:RNA polymerase alpha subunit C-terminal domain-containing protein [Ureibacillus chungkukjangi]PYF06815.1 RNA polymerase alpha subunit [Ureibacillus chungkukjangi]